jgi:hypothetical protein
MNLQGYETFSDEKLEKFEFNSIGVNGIIRKVVFFENVGFNIFNLAFGDWDELNGKLNDEKTTNNGDRDKVLATVALTVVNFLRYHPDSIVFAMGRTNSRTRLFQMGINSNWYKIQTAYYIEGYLLGRWEKFQSGKNYEAFSVRLK